MNRALVILSLFGILAATAPAMPGQETVRASLVSAEDGLAPGRSTTIALKLEIAEHWHTYWINPGDSGFPTSLEWDLPEGYAASPLAFPVPSPFTTAGTAGYGYQGTVYHLVDIQVPATVEVGSTITLRATAQWLACDPESCQRGAADLEISLPVRAAADIAPTAHAAAIAATAIPVSLPGRTLAVKDAGAELIITIPEALEPEGLLVFPETPGVIDATAPLKTETNGSVTTLTLLKHANSGFMPEELTLLLVPADGPAIRIGTTPIEATFTPVPALSPANDPTPGDTARPSVGSRVVNLAEQSAAIREMYRWGVEGKGKQHSLAGILVLALLGGITLNLMPCVFPVLGIKIMGFVQQAGEDRASIRRHGLVFGAGVLVSLWTLAAVILAIRLGGDQVGWGFQLQNPTFVLVMVVVMFVFGLNLAGLFEFGTSLIGAGQGLQHQQGYAGSFFSGVLAVAIATPCTGPFMGAALTYALSAPVHASLLVFTALGAGLALPYVLLSFFPALIEKLPRPGPWMETLKQFMAFPMLAAAIWLLGVLGRNLGAEGLQRILYGLVILAFGLWIYGRFDVPARSRRSRLIARAASLLFIGYFALLAADGIEIGRTGQATAATGTGSDEAVDGESFLLPPSKQKYGLEWQPLDAVAIVQHRKKGRTVFIDFTADW